MSCRRSSPLSSLSRERARRQSVCRRSWSADRAYCTQIQIVAQKKGVPHKDTLERYLRVFIRDFKETREYHDILDKKMVKGHTQGRYEILRHAAAANVPMDDLKKWYLTAGCIQSLRDYHHLFPFSMGDCIDTREINQRSLHVEDLWVPLCIVPDETMEFRCRGSCSYVQFTEDDIKR